MSISLSSTKKNDLIFDFEFDISTLIEDIKWLRERYIKFYYNGINISHMPLNEIRKVAEKNNSTLWQIGILIKKFVEFENIGQFMLQEIDLKKLEVILKQKTKKDIISDAIIIKKTPKKELEKVLLT